MPLDPPGLLLSEPDTAIVEKLAVAERACLAIAAATVLASTVEWYMPGLRAAFPATWAPLSGESWFATVLCGIAVYLAHPRFGERLHRLSAALGVVTALGSCAALIDTFIHLHSGTLGAGVAQEIDFFRLHFVSRMSGRAGAGFLVLGLAIAFLQVEKRLVIVADVVCWSMGLIILTLASAQIIGSFSFFGPLAPATTSHQTMICLFVLGAGAFFRQARRGAFRIFLGRGIGSRVVRALTPFLLIIPYFREALRGHLFTLKRMPSHYVTAFLASLAVAISMVLLLYVAWRFNALETEVHDLSLRDPLTDLYNLRGFRFLAEQALRLARRSGQPFSLLFIDVDGLKLINDELGHQTGSEFLVQTSEIMKETFREVDVMGRIGGDEFAVAGQFNEEAILRAADRLLDAATARNASTRYEIPLSFSIGHVTSAPSSRDSLDDLLASADEAMYQVKRRRKSVLSRQE